MSLIKAFPVTLPFDVLDEIVGFLGDEGAKNTIPCLYASSQLRQCAQRQIFRQISIDLAGPSHRLETLNACIKPNPSSSTSPGVSRFIKTVSLAIPARRYSSPVPLDEDTIVLLLECLLNEVAVRDLIFKVSRDQPGSFDKVTYWDDMSPRVQHHIQSIARLPTVRRIYINGFMGLPADTLPAHTSEIRLFNWKFGQSAPSTEESNNTSSLTLNPNIRLIPYTFKALRSITVLHLSPTDQLDGWKLIMNGSETLEEIKVYDNDDNDDNLGWMDNALLPRLPWNVKLGVFCKLRRFYYSYTGYSWAENASFLHAITPFFQLDQSDSCLEVLELDFTLHRHPMGGGLFDDAWDDAAQIIPSDPGWTQLDGSLASGQFPALTSVSSHISLRIPILGVVEWEDIEFVADRPAIKKQTEENLVALFKGSRDRSFALEIEVTADF